MDLLLYKLSIKKELDNLIISIDCIIYGSLRMCAAYLQCTSAKSLMNNIC